MKKKNDRSPLEEYRDCITAFQLIIQNYRNSYYSNNYIASKGEYYVQYRFEVVNLSSGKFKFPDIIIVLWQGLHV